MGGRDGIEAYLYLLDEAFHGPGIEETNESQAFMTNLASVPDDAWRALPPGDAELDRPRQTNWGELRPTRWIVAAMITHDAYHAGEINHLRSLLGTDDRWRYQQGIG
jgi:hypothetical protein